MNTNKLSHDLVEKFNTKEFLEKFGEHGAIKNFMEVTGDTISINKGGLRKIAELGFSDISEEQFTHIVRQDSGKLGIVYYTGISSDISSWKVGTKTIDSLEGLNTNLRLLAEFMAGFESTPIMKINMLEPLLVGIFGDKGRIKSKSEPLEISTRQLPDEVRDIMNRKSLVALEA